jgi:addiction module HigA family antidote
LIVTKWRKEMIKSALPPVHPGQFLHETLDGLGISQASFARTIDVAPMRISHVVTGARPVTAELALLFGHAFKQSPQYWLNLQSVYDLRLAERQIGTRLATMPELISI